MPRENPFDPRHAWSSPSFLAARQELPVDSIAGPETERVLLELSGADRAPSPSAATPMVRVANALVTPYRWICRIVARAYNKPENEYSVGTGVLVSPYHVLTCAHVIYPREAPRTKTIDVYPAQNGPSDNASRLRANGWTVSPGWRPNDCHTAGEDYGIIRLTSPAPHGFFQLHRFDPAIVTRTTVSLAGYPDDRERRAQHMYRSSGSVTGAVVIDGCGRDRRGNDTIRGRIIPSILSSTFLVAHELAASHAVSGAPMWIEADGVRTLIGLHARNVDESRRRAAVLLNETVRSQVARWMNTNLPALRH